MPIDVNSPFFHVLAEWVKELILRPDPPPEQLVQVNDAVILTAISVLTERLSPEIGNELRRALPVIQARLKAA
jgi:hypothetical protein